MTQVRRIVDSKLDDLFGQVPAMAIDGPTMLGNLFESLVTLGVCVPAQGVEAEFAHMRTRNGDHEVDLVVVRDDGRALAIVISAGPSV